MSKRCNALMVSPQFRVCLFRIADIVLIMSVISLLCTLVAMGVTITVREYSLENRKI